MRGSQTQKVKDGFLYAQEPEKIIPPHLDAPLVLSKCPDFFYERTALQECIESRGHILLASVVCTPETAGCGIEYAWGKLKFEQRQENDRAGGKLEAGAKFVLRVKTLCLNTNILPMIRVWRFNRRARDYIRLYLELGNRIGATALTYKEIEKMKKKCSYHRNIMEVDREFVQAN